MSRYRIPLFGLLPNFPTSVAVALTMAFIGAGCEDAKKAAADLAADKFKSDATKAAEALCVKAVSEAEGKRGFKLKGPPGQISSAQLGKTQFQVRVSYSRTFDAPDGIPGAPIPTESICEAQGAEILNVQMGMTTEDWDRELKAIAEKNRRDNPEPAPPPEPKPVVAAAAKPQEPVYDAAMNERISKVMEEIHSRYPSMDEKSAKFNQRIFDSVALQQKEYVNRGRPPDQAWRLAAYDVARAVAINAVPVDQSATQKKYDPRVLPASAHWIIEGATWACNAGFYPNAMNQECLAVRVPDNGMLDASGRGWQCRPGFVQLGQSCVQSTAGASQGGSVATSRAPRCATGFKSVEGRCEALPPPPENARYDMGSDTWHCVPGYYLLKGRCVSDGTH